ncbi:hypothetical protein ACFQZU_13070, partial [Streptomonospora algeriensis]
MPGRHGRRARLSVVPTQAPAEDPACESAPAATTVSPGARDGALFDWAQQIPEWSDRAAAP